MPRLPAERLIEPSGPIDATVRVPGSKSITNRALLIAALAQGPSELSGPLSSDDTDVMREALDQFGVSIDAQSETWRVQGVGGQLAQPNSSLWVQNSGTTARFLTAAATLAPGPTTLDGNPRMRERPIVHLLSALEALGAPAEALGEHGCPPVRVRGGGLPGGSVTIDGSQSSQYTSAVLLAAPYASQDVVVDFAENLIVSKPYVDITLKMMRDFGAKADWIEDGNSSSIHVESGMGYQGRPYAIEPDASSAAYPFCAAAIAGGSIRVAGVPEDSLQSDWRILELLERMGCQIDRSSDEVSVTGPDQPLRSLGEVDMNEMPDAVLAYAVVALFADGPTLIKNVWNLRIKETDRLAALENELRKLGARAEAGKDWLRIQPGPLQGAEIDTYDDHRMAMSFSLAGLRVPGVVIRDPGCVSKTWPDYFDAFGQFSD